MDMNQDIVKSYYEQQRLRKQALYRQYYIKLNNLNYIKSYIIAGGNPAENPDISAEYFMLIQEGLLPDTQLCAYNTEDNFFLIKEEDKIN